MDVEINVSSNNEAYLNALHAKYPDIIKVIDITNKKQSLFDDIYHWNGKYWEELESMIFENSCLEILKDLGVEKDTKQQKIMNLPALKGGVSCKRCIVYEVRSVRKLFNCGV
jgi:hypothetical protein